MKYDGMIRSFFIEEQEFTTFSSLVTFFQEHFDLVSNYFDELLEFIQYEDSDSYEALMKMLNGIQSPENRSTILLYFMDIKKRIFIKENTFFSLDEMIAFMKVHYPMRIQEIEHLLQEPVLSMISWHQFLETNELSYKRRYLFIKQCEDHIAHSFIYYYIIFMYLEKHESVSFVFAQKKHRNLQEIGQALLENRRNANQLIFEILSNDIILALLAKQCGVVYVLDALKEQPKYGILRIIQALTPELLTPVVKHQMSFWMVKNFQHYQYLSPEAISIRKKYEAITIPLDFASFEDLILFSIRINQIYQEFLAEYNHDWLLELRPRICAENEQYYLNYFENQEYVCESYLREEAVYQSTIHTDLHRLQMEKSYLLETLEQEKDHFQTYQEQAKIMLEKLDIPRYRRFHKYVLWLALVLCSLIVMVFLNIFLLENQAIQLIYGSIGGFLVLLAGCYLFYCMKRVQVYHSITEIEYELDTYAERVEHEKREICDLMNTFHKPLNQLHILKSALVNDAFYLDNLKELERISAISPKKNKRLGRILYYLYLIPLYACIMGVIQKKTDSTRFQLLYYGMLGVTVVMMVISFLPLKRKIKIGINCGLLLTVIVVSFLVVLGVIK